MYFNLGLISRTPVFLYTKYDMDITHPKMANINLVSNLIQMYTGRKSHPSNFTTQPSKWDQ